MKEMEQKILEEGKVLPGGILKVGSFLNQRIDTVFLSRMGKEIAKDFAGKGVDLILTIESSGIAIAAAAGIVMEVPVVFAKKHKTSNVDGEVFSTEVHSFTHDEDYNVVVSKDYLAEGAKVLLIDDFLASGNALHGLCDLVEQAGAELVGIAVAIEKEFQGGGDSLRKRGIIVDSLAKIKSMDDGAIEFC